MEPVGATTQVTYERKLDSGLFPPVLPPAILGFAWELTFKGWHKVLTGYIRQEKSPVQRFASRAELYRAGSRARFRLCSTLPPSISSADCGNGGILTIANPPTSIRVQLDFSSSSAPAQLHALFGSAVGADSGLPANASGRSLTPPETSRDHSGRGGRFDGLHHRHLLNSRQGHGCCYCAVEVIGKDRRVWAKPSALRKHPA